MRLYRTVDREGHHCWSFSGSRFLRHVRIEEEENFIPSCRKLDRLFYLVVSSYSAIRFSSQTVPPFDDCTVFLVLSVGKSEMKDDKR